jgi:hypothetical protein
MKVYIIKAQSGISGTCNMGAGLTEKDAWQDALGPDPSPQQKKLAKTKYWVSEEEHDSLECVSFQDH